MVYDWVCISQYAGQSIPRFVLLHIYLKIFAVNFIFTGAFSPPYMSRIRAKISNYPLSTFSRWLIFFFLSNRLMCVSLLCCCYFTVLKTGFCLSEWLTSSVELSSVALIKILCVLKFLTCLCQKSEILQKNWFLDKLHWIVQSNVGLVPRNSHNWNLILKMLI